MLRTLAHDIRCGGLTCLVQVLLFGSRMMAMFFEVARTCVRIILVIVVIDCGCVGSKCFIALIINMKSHVSSRTPVTQGRSLPDPDSLPSLVEAQRAREAAPAITSIHHPLGIFTKTRA